jgi:hypothetical protein
MTQAITATYAQDNDDWSITVAGLGRESTARAPGIIAARDRADQLVEKLTGAEKQLTVVHLLNGSALEFTSAYMTARLTRPTTEPPEPIETTEPEVPAQARTESEPADTGTAKKSRKRTVPTKELAKSPDEASTVAGKGAASGEPVGKGRRDTRRKIAR